MNQILKPEILSNQQNSDIYNSQYKKNKSYNFYKIQFIISCFVAFCFIIAFLIRILSLNKNDKIAEQLMNIYNVSTLYSNDTNYSSQLLKYSDNQNTFYNNYTPFVIGIIKIDKINLNYPILSESNKELLNISICRFAGPLPNESRKSLYCWP